MSSGFYEFGPFRIDINRRIFYRDGQPAPLSPKVFDTLVELVRRAGTVVTKDELVTLIWPDCAVDENSLPRAVSSLRKALGERTSDHQYIVTIPGRGYQFVASVREGIEEPISGGKEEERPRAKYGYRAYALGGLGIFAAGVVVTALLHANRIPPASPFESTVTAKITSSGRLKLAALSPNGRDIAYIHRESGLEGLILRHIASSQELAIVPPADVLYMGLTFSPDSGKIFYVSRSSRPGPGSLYTVLATGGRVVRLKDGLESPATVSPNGEQLAFVRESNGESRLIIAALASGSESELFEQKLPLVIDYPSWSPNGQTIACTSYNSSQGSDPQVIGVEVATGKASVIAEHKWGFIRQLSWLGGGSSLVVSGRGLESSPFHLWLISYPEGAVRKLTDGTSQQDGVSASRNSRQLVTIEDNWYSSLWRVRLPQLQNPELVTSDVTGKASPVWMPDGRILFEHYLDGVGTLWTVDSNRNQKRLPLPGNSYDASLSRDGKLVAFVSENGGGTAVLTMDIDGRNPLKLHAPGWFPSLSPDGRWVVFTARGSGGWQSLWKAGARGGQSKELSDNLWTRPAVSPDGKWIAGFYADVRRKFEKYPTSIAVIGLDGGEPSRVYQVPRSASDSAGLRWTPDGRQLSYVLSGDEGDNIWNQPLDGGDPYQITNFRGDSIFGFDWSPDGKQLVFSKGIQSRDIILIREGRAR